MSLRLACVASAVVVLSLAGCGSDSDAESSFDVSHWNQGYAAYETRFGYVNSQGDYIVRGYLIRVVLCSPEVTITAKTASGTGDCMVLGFVSSDASSLPERTYLGIDYDYENDGRIKYGDIYLGMDAATIAKGTQNYAYGDRWYLSQGYVSVSRSGNDYTFGFDLKGAVGKPVRGTITVPGMAF